MYKGIFAIIGLFGVLSFSCGMAEEPLKATVSKIWTVDMARQEAFKNLVPQIDVSQFPAIDPNLIENLQIRSKGGGILGDRVITVFNSGIYSVDEKCSLLSNYYYSNGKILKIGISSGIAYSTENCSYSFPLKEYDYCMGLGCAEVALPQGSLMDISIRVSLHESFNFRPDGSLLTHWKGGNCYNVDGSSCGTRTSFENNSK